MKREQVPDHILKHILKYKESLIYSSFFYDLFVNCKKENITEYEYDKNNNTIKVLDKKYFYFPKGRLFTLDNENNDYFYTIEEVLDIDTYKIYQTDIKNNGSMDKIIDIHSEFILQKGMINNYTDNKPLKTTLGKFYFNYVFLSSIFGNLFPYDNDTFDPDRYEKQICQYAIEGKIKAEQISKYIDRLMFLMKYGSVILTSLTKNLLVPKKEFIEYKKQLLEKYKDKLNDPEIAVKVEHELIDKLKELLKDDPSKFFVTKKTFNNVLKRMFIGFGFLEPFGEIKTDEVKFLTTTLDEGIKKDEIPQLFNEVRRASFGRAKDSAKGGALTKFLARAYQSVQITEDDCKSKDGILITITDDNKEDYLYRYAIINNKLVLLTSDNINQFLNKTIKIRSPMFCKSDDFCYKCFGYKYEKLKLKRLVAEVLEIGSTFLSISMKSMHVVSVDGYEIDSLNKFVL